MHFSQFRTLLSYSFGFIVIARPTLEGYWVIEPCPPGTAGKGTKPMLLAPTVSEELLMLASTQLPMYIIPALPVRNSSIEVL